MGVKSVRREVIVHYPEYIPKRTKPLDPLEEAAKNEEYVKAKIRSCEREWKRLELLKLNKYR